MQVAEGNHPLKEGVYRYSDKDPNAMQIMGKAKAAYAGDWNPANRLGTHNHEDTYKAGMHPEKWPNTVENWVENTMRGMYILLYDCYGLCKFAKPTFEQITQLYESATGESITVDDLKNSAKNLFFTMMSINKKLGTRREDYVMPERCYEDHERAIEHFFTREFDDAYVQAMWQRFEQETQLDI